MGIKGLKWILMLTVLILSVYSGDCLICYKCTDIIQPDCIWQEKESVMSFRSLVRQLKMKVKYMKNDEKEEEEEKNSNYYNVSEIDWNLINVERCTSQRSVCLAFVIEYIYFESYYTTGSTFNLYQLQEVDDNDEIRNYDDGSQKKEAEEKSSDDLESVDIGALQKLLMDDDYSIDESSSLAEEEKLTQGSIMENTSSTEINKTETIQNMTTQLDPNGTITDMTTQLDPNGTITDMTTQLDPNGTITDMTTPLNPNGTITDMTTPLDPNGTITVAGTRTTEPVPNKTLPEPWDRIPTTFTFRGCGSKVNKICENVEALRNLVYSQVPTLDLRRYRVTKCRFCRTRYCNGAVPSSPVKNNIYILLICVLISVFVC